MYEYYSTSGVCQKNKFISKLLAQLQPIVSRYPFGINVMGPLTEMPNGCTSCGRILHKLFYSESELRSKINQRAIQTFENR